MQIADTDSKVTVDIMTIRTWVTDRAGVPARDEAGRLTIVFPPLESPTQIKPVSWEGFEKTFNEQGLAFIYQETTGSGAISRYFKLARR